MNTDVALAEPKAKIDPDLSDQQFTASSLVLSEGAMDRLYRFAEMMAAGVRTVPEHLRGNVADCFAVCTQAQLWGMNPFGVASKTHISKSGQLSYDGQLVNAVITNRAPIKHRPEYEFLGDWSKILGRVEERTSDKGGGGKYYVAAWKPQDEAGLGVIVRCTLKGEDKPREVTVMMTQAYPRFSTQWATDPQQQICFLGVRKWARRYTPDVLLGVYVPEELAQVEPPRDMGPAEIVEGNRPAELSEAKIKQWRAEAEKGMAAVRAFWLKSMTAADRNLATEAQKREMWDLAVEADKKRTVDDDKPPAEPAKTVDQAADNAAPTAKAKAADKAEAAAPAVDPGVQDFIDEMDRVDNGK